MPTEEPIAIETVAPIEKPGTKYVYISTQRCPASGCGRFWSYEVAAARGEIDKNPHRALTLGMALLCGECEAKRRATSFVLAPGEWKGKAKVRKFWDKPEEDAAWKIIQGAPRDYHPRIERREEWDGRVLLDEKNMELERIFRFRGRWVPLMTPESLQRLGLDWVPYG